MAMEGLVIVGAGLVRSLAGWVENALGDGKVDMPEWKQLGETIVRVGLIGVVVYYFPWFELSSVESAAVAVGGDMFAYWVKKLKHGKKSKRR